MTSNVDVSISSNEHPTVSVDYSNDDEFDSLRDEALDVSTYIPPHPLAVKPAGNQYSATLNSRDFIGSSFQSWPDELLALFLDYLEPGEIVRLGSTCKFWYAFCRADELWKTLFIE